MNPIEIFKNYLNSLIEIEPLEWEMLSSFLSVETYKEKQFLDLQGEEVQNLYFLLDGVVRVFRLRDNKEYTYNLYSNPRFIANIGSLIKGTPAQHSIQALCNTTILKIRFVDAHKLYEILPKYERIGRLFTEAVLLQEVERIDELTCYEPFERFQNLLATTPELMERIPQKYVASYLGISPESLSRMKAKLAVKSN